MKLSTSLQHLTIASVYVFPKKIILHCGYSFFKIEAKGNVRITSPIPSVRLISMFLIVVLFFKFDIFYECGKRRNITDAKTLPTVKETTFKKIISNKFPMCF